MDIQIKVNNTLYYVIFEHNGTEFVHLPKSKDDERPAVLGVTDVINRRIYIHDGLDRNLMERTLKQELTCAYLFEYIPIKDFIFNQEEICNFVAIYGGTINEQAKFLLNKFMDNIKGANR